MIGSWRFVILLCALLIIACNPSQDSDNQAVVMKSEYSSQTPTPDQYPYQVGFLIMDGVYNTELTAPFDIFHHTVFRKGIRPMHVFTVAEFTRPITTFEGLKITPDYTIDDEMLPEIDILVVPSAEHHLDSDLENDEILSFIKTTSQTADFITSHCDGAFMLAQAGVLNGHASTTFPSDIEKYKTLFPHLEVISDVIFVHDNKFITSAGGAKSFEASLYLCELLYGKTIADQLAKGLVIDWNLSDVPHAIIGVRM